MPLNDIEAIRQATAGNPNVVAVFFEAIQGEGGVNPMDADYMREVRALCDANDWLLMIDEVQCGMGRTGKWFAHQWAGILPDVMPLARGLGWRADRCRRRRPQGRQHLRPGNHGTTFGGNPLSVRAGPRPSASWKRTACSENAARVGQHLQTALLTQLMGVAGVRQVRGKGLMIGVELDRPCGVLVNRCADAGLLLSVTADSVVRMVPPLILSVAEADEIVATLVP